MARPNLFRLAREAPGSLSFEELCDLASQIGLVEAGRTPVHTVFRRPDGSGVVTLQDDGGRAKPYQVDLVLAAADDFGFRYG